MHHHFFKSKCGAVLIVYCIQIAPNLFSDLKAQNYFVLLIIFLIINDFHLNLDYDCESEGNERTPLFEEPNAERINTSEQTKYVTSAENPQGQFKIISLTVKFSCTYLEAY